MTAYPRVLICGDRNWSDRMAFDLAMDRWIAKHGLPETIIEGCARGADSMAGHEWAYDNPIGLVQVDHYPANWDRYGKSAGPRRNEQMLVEGKPDAVIAFHADLANSKGTAHMVRIARAAGLPVWVAVKQPQP